MSKRLALAWAPGSIGHAAECQGNLVEYQEPLLPCLRRLLGDPGPWIQTYSGAPFHPLRPERLDVRLIDVMQGLSNVCRYGGQSRDFYSVAQHSVMVSRLVPRELALVGLFHDASEAYLGDIPRPIKTVLAPLYKPLERAVAQRIGERFGLTLTDMPPEIEHADRVVLATERRDVMYRSEVSYPWDERGLLEPLPEKIEPWQPQRARTEFLRRFIELTVG